MRIDLFWLTSDQTAPPEWESGQILVVSPTPSALAAAADGLTDTNADFILFWDAALGMPDPATIRDIASRPGDVWHAGLRLGLSGLPRWIDFVDPVWRFNRDPKSDQIATSWRLSLQACLVKRDVLLRLGVPAPQFDTVTGASLELGHRWIRGGAMMRHIPELLSCSAGNEISAAPPTLADEVRFLRLRYGRMWTAWALWRAWRHGHRLADVWSAYRQPAPTNPVAAGGLHDLSAPEPPIEHHPASFSPPVWPVPQAVSVLIPTLDRYPHLFTLLAQLGEQTLPPHEIVVVDQTAETSRDHHWPSRFSGLPLKVIWREQAGQCSSRNAGLTSVSGDAVLFLDDDDEIPPDLIAYHLAYFERFGVDASCGVAEEVGAGPLPGNFKLIRDSDVFPTNNSMLRMTALVGSGMFDLAYERGERADGDLGMRLYISGAQLGLNPRAAALHLHAPRGGLRQHKARVDTRSASRASIRHRHLLAPTEGYLWSRYFTETQVKEALLIRTIGTLRGSQTGLRRLLRAIYMTILLPDTWRQNRERLARGQAMLDEFPNIPRYEPNQSEELLAI